ncbi:hypothetical protein [Corynebacterium aquilae]|uniref:Uncharacterized protein n=1 Tax=Corynebacterium aquilae DSM 44791 TaxID=1431546 RepID=A0A1L7CIA6_9CORY|nr:hypothetical protein [Corynebacterium aquilae]APT85590.1 hypothetical protein CAQU_11670 [Corynebacterium aquilae DSM 44791]
MSEPETQTPTTQPNHAPGCLFFSPYLILWSWTFAFVPQLSQVAGDLGNGKPIAVEWWMAIFIVVGFVGSLYFAWRNLGPRHRPKYLGAWAVYVLVACIVSAIAYVMRMDRDTTIGLIVPWVLALSALGLGIYLVMKRNSDADANMG